MITLIKKIFRRKKRIAFIEMRLNALEDVLEYYTTLKEFNRNLLDEAENIDQFEKLADYESKAILTMISVENEIKQLKDELRKLI